MWLTWDLGLTFLLVIEHLHISFLINLACVRNSRLGLVKRSLAYAHYLPLFSFAHKMVNWQICPVRRGPSGMPKVETSLHSHCWQGVLQSNTARR